jgi:dihydroflavonol-4-reductase
MKALVTGANGHIGCHVVRAARDAGMEPVAFVREGCDRRGLAGVDVELRTGDLLDADSVRRAMEGVEVVFHVAAVHKNFAANPDDIVRPAVEGTRNVLDAARATGVRRVVYTSTGATVGFTSDPGRALTEDDFLETAESPYTRGKIEAEKVVRAASDVDVVIVNPSGVFGPRDYRLTPASRAIVGTLQGDPIFLHLCTTDVRDVATAHTLAATQGQKGRRYIATGDVLAPKDTVALFTKLAGVKPSTFTPPRFLANFLAGRMEKKALASGGDAGLTRAIVKDNIGRHLVYDSSRARTELGATFRPAEQVLRDTFRWLLHLGALAPKTAARVTRALGESSAPDPGWTN